MGNTGGRLKEKIESLPETLRGYVMRRLKDFLFRTKGKAAVTGRGRVRHAARHRSRTSVLRPGISPAARRAVFELLESRTLLNAGGGFTNAGIQGEYYSSATALAGTPVTAPYGSPAFTRQDVRIDFNWGTTGQPGGSPDPAFTAVSINNFSVLWSGEVNPKYSETYTFTATTVGQDVLFIRLHGSSNWTTLVSDWTVHGVTADTATYAFTAGQTYDIEMEYAQPTSGAAAECILQWSSFSTPLEAIEVATPVGINYDGGDALFANMVNGGTRNYWWVPGNQNATVATDSNFWPTADAEIFLGEGDTTLDSGGTFLIQFKGTAKLSQQYVSASFWVGTTNYGGTLPDGDGYNSSTGLTTAKIVISPSSTNSYNGFILEFTNTSREGNISSPQKDGITNLYVMQPTTLGGSTDPRRERCSPVPPWPWPRSMTPFAAWTLRLPTAAWSRIGPTGRSPRTRSGTAGLFPAAAA